MPIHGLRASPNFRQRFGAVPKVVPDRSLWDFCLLVRAEETVDKSDECDTRACAGRNALRVENRRVAVGVV